MEKILDNLYIGNQQDYEKTLIEWSEISGIDRATIARRINVGWGAKDWLKPVFHNKDFKYANKSK